MSDAQPIVYKIYSWADYTKATEIAKSDKEGAKDEATKYMVARTMKVLNKESTDSTVGKSTFGDLLKKLTDEYKPETAEQKETQRYVGEALGKDGSKDGDGKEYSAKIFVQTPGGWAKSADGSTTFRKADLVMGEMYTPKTADKGVEYLEAKLYVQLETNAACVPTGMSLERML